MTTVTDLMSALAEFREQFGNLDVVLVQPDSYGYRYQFTDPVVEITPADPRGRDYVAGLIRGAGSRPVDQDGRPDPNPLRPATPAPGAYGDGPWLPCGCVRDQVAHGAGHRPGCLGHERHAGDTTWTRQVIEQLDQATAHAQAARTDNPMED